MKNQNSTTVQMLTNSRTHQVLRKITYFLMLISLISLTSCKDDFLPQAEENVRNDKNFSLTARTFSGDSLLLQNPYELQNMRDALDKIKNENPNFKFTDYKIDPSHVYLKFTPHNEDQVGLLKQDSTIHYFDYRMDCEYRDGFLASRQPDSDSITVYYTAVPKDKVLPNVPHEVLAELYIPEEDSYFNDIDHNREEYILNKTGSDKTDFYINLIYNAFAKTNNLEDVLVEGTTNRLFAKKWYPSGNIKVNDDVAGIKPVTGAQVLMRQWFTVRQGITDGNGNFSTDWVKGKAKYVIQRERYNYSVRNGLFFQAEMDGPNVKEQSWSVVINGGQNEYHALIHQAAHDYYYGYRFGIASPPKNNTFYSFGLQRQIKIAAREESGGTFTGAYSHAASEVTLGLYPQIRIRTWGFPSDQVYGTVIHELSHAVHSVVDKPNYDFLVSKGWTLPGYSVPINIRNSSRRLLETWALTPEILMTNYRYLTTFHVPSYEVYISSTNSQEKYNLQGRTIAYNNYYTPVGYDMTETLNQRLNSSSYPIDRVSGYSLLQLQQALVGVGPSGWNGWRDKIKNNYNNPTEQYLDELFGNWVD